MPQLSQQMDEFISNNYPQFEDQIRSHFGAPPKNKTTQGQMSQMSLDPKATIDSNLNSLVSVINSPISSADERTKALSSYKMIINKMQQNQQPEISAGPQNSQQTVNTPNSTVQLSAPQANPQVSQSALQQLMNKYNTNNLGYFNNYNDAAAAGQRIQAALPQIQGNNQ